MDTATKAAIRQALRDANRTVSLRALARMVSMSPAGLRHVMEGVDPHPKTWAKLHRWYVEHAQEGERAGVDAARAAVALLVDGLAPEVRGPFRTELAAVVARLHGEAGLPLPAWIGAEGSAAYTEGQQNRAARFATVDLMNGDTFALVRPPFEGEPRAVVESIGTERGVWNGGVYYPPHRISRVWLGGE